MKRGGPFDEIARVDYRTVAQLNHPSEAPFVDGLLGAPVDESAAGLSVPGAPELGVGHEPVRRVHGR